MPPAAQPPTRLLAVPNVSEGRDPAVIDALRRALLSSGGIELLDVHSDADHHRSVYTLAGAPEAVADALVRAAREAVGRIDVMSSAAAEGRRGEHPHVGALDVAPIVYLNESARGAAIAQALVLADRLGEELAVPVFLYGELGGGRTRAQLRAGGVAGLARRVAADEVSPDFGPARLHPSAGATLVAAREPLVAFNLQLTPPATVKDARRIAALIRDGGAEGLPGVRAMGVRLTGREIRGAQAQAPRREGVPGSDISSSDREASAAAATPHGAEVAQVSMNVERPLEVPLAIVIERVRRHAEIASAELVGLAPAAALEGWPEDVELPGFDPCRHVIEQVMGLAGADEGPARAKRQEPAPAER
jgi:glutamate formiminotransferase / 5-formyltetrahydrofolate cyclo-ligase